MVPGAAPARPFMRSFVCLLLSTPGARHPHPPRNHASLGGTRHAYLAGAAALTLLPPHMPQPQATALSRPHPPSENAYPFLKMFAFEKLLFLCLSQARLYNSSRQRQVQQGLARFAGTRAEEREHHTCVAHA